MVKKVVYVLKMHVKEVFDTKMQNNAIVGSQPSTFSYDITFHIGKTEQIHLLRKKFQKDFNNKLTL